MSEYVYHLCLNSFQFSGTFEPNARGLGGVIPETGGMLSASDSESYSPVSHVDLQHQCQGRSAAHG